ncbi:MAG: hypothetical protein ACC662_11070, partial [Planctomycetota bacterium]
MIVLLKRDASPDVVARLMERIRDEGLEVVPLQEGGDRAFEVVGAERGRVLPLAGAEGVEAILTRRTPLHGGEPLWPHFTIRVTILALVLLSVLLIMAAFLPSGLGDAAQAAGGSPAAGMPWYLRPLAWLYGLFPPSLHWLSGTLVLLFWAGLFFLPFLDRPPRSPRAVVRR